MLLAILLAMASLFIGAGLRAEEEQTDDRPVWHWIPQKPPYWWPRYYHGAVVHNDRIWMMGGLSINNWLNDVWSTEDGETWVVESAVAPWSTRAKFQVVSFKGRMYLMGGYKDLKDGIPLCSEVWSSADGKDWTFEGDAPWAPRSDFRAIVFKDQILVMGGHGEWKRLNDVWATSDGKNWECLTESAPWAPRSQLSSVVHKDRLLIGGGLYFDYDIVRVGENQKPYYGRQNGTYSMRTDVWATDDGRSWTLLEERAAFGGRYQADWISIGDHIWMMHSGDFVEGPGFASGIWVSRDGTDWFEISKPRDKKQRFDGRQCGTFLWYKDRIWGIGGAHQNWGYLVFEDKTTYMAGNFMNPEDHRLDPEDQAVPLPLPGEPGYGDIDKPKKPVKPTAGNNLK